MRPQYNAHRYSNLTAVQARTHVAREEKAKVYQSPLQIYVCSPFAGDTELNVLRAQRYCRFVVSKGYMPLAPHLHFPQFMDDDDQQERELGLTFALILLGICHEIWVFGGKVTDGMAREINEAKKRAIPIWYFNESCEEVKSI